MQYTCSAVPGMWIGRDKCIYPSSFCLNMETDSPGGSLLLEKGRASAKTKPIPNQYQAEANLDPIQHQSDSK